MADAKETLAGWGHGAGLIDLGAGTTLTDGDQGRQVIERVARYCWSYDERRREHLADCFTENAVWEGNVLGEIGIGPFEGREKIVQWLTEFWPHQADQRRHMLLNNLVEQVADGRAVTFSYLLLMGCDGRSSSIECTGFYRCEHVLEGETWRIARLTAGFDCPFWPGELDSMSQRGKHRHGVFEG